jgi:hypothetical protein
MLLTGPLRKTSDALRWAFGFCVTGSIVTIGLSLSRWGAAEVRSDGSEVLLLTFVGAIWLALGLMVFPWMGVSYRDDVVERRNPAALVALCGAIFGLALIYAGGGIGEGLRMATTSFPPDSEPVACLPPGSF